MVLPALLLGVNFLGFQNNFFIESSSVIIISRETLNESSFKQNINFSYVN